MKTGLKTVRLNEGRERSLKRFHPWVYSGAIASVEGTITEGDAVEVVDSRGEFLGCGFYSGSSIAIKIFSFRKVAPDPAYWTARIEQARTLREKFSLRPDSSVTNAFRLINGEGDGIPGLIVDVYGEIAVIQCHSVATFRMLDQWKDAIQSVYGELISTIYCKSADTLRSEDSALKGEDLFLVGERSSTVVVENGLRFAVNVEEGQKTGFFVDQRDSRALVREISGGQRVLNLFCYTGGFSIAAIAGGAAAVTSVDVSGVAIEMARRNLAENGHGPEMATFLESDCFKYLEGATERFDLIIVDPPPFAKSRATVDRALQGYKAINNLALKRLEKNGAMLTFSCSQVVGVDPFTQAVSEAGIETGRQLRIARDLSSPVCHPVSLYHPEGDYLKGLYLVSEN